MPNTSPTDGTPSRPAHPRTAYKESREQEKLIFSRRLWRLMTSKKWNQSELSRRSGIGRDMISGYVRGKNLPDPPHAQRLADAFGVPIENLFPRASEADLKEAPEMEMYITGPVTMVHINLEMPTPLALQIHAMLEAWRAEVRGSVPTE